MEIRPIYFEKWNLRILNQNLLPEEEKYLDLEDLLSIVDAIRTLKVRGAPAIGIAAAYAFVIGVREELTKGKTVQESSEIVAETIKLSRPTAVNLFNSLERMKTKALEISERDSSREESLEELITEAERIHKEDIQSSRKMAINAFPLLKHARVVLTHCNTGALATGGLGTALYVIRHLHKTRKDLLVLVTETRPLLQGSRLTAWELEKYKIPYRVITDSAAASAMEIFNVDAVVVGADRVALNGDAANKIGTFGLAASAKVQNVPFYIICPFTSIDPQTPGGKLIEIEIRSESEIAYFNGKKLVPDPGRCWNPAFDVTPSEHISAIITDKGVLKPPYEDAILRFLGR